MKSLLLLQDTNYPPIENFGSLVATFKVLAQMEGKFENIYEYPEIATISSEVEGVEKMVLQNLLNLQDQTFTDLLYAFFTHNNGKLHYSAHNDVLQPFNETTDKMFQFKSKERSLLMGILSKALTMSSDASVHSSSLSEKMKTEMSNIYEGISNKLHPSPLPFCIHGFTSMGQTDGLEHLPICDIVEPVLTDTGLCFAFNAKSSIDFVICFNTKLRDSLFECS